MLSNVPDQHTRLRLAAGKSFSLAIHFKDAKGAYLPLDDSEASLSIAKIGRLDPEVVLTKRPTILNESQGALRFDLQSADLDLPPGEYAYEVVVESLGYSTMVIRGDIELELSFDRTFASRSYTDPGATGNINAVVTKNHITVQSSNLAVRGGKGDTGEAGRPGDPFEEVRVTYTPEGHIESIWQAGVLTEYEYNPDGTIALDRREGLTRNYNYDNGQLVSINPQRL